MKYFLSFFLFSGVLSSCEPDEGISLRRGAEYFTFLTGTFQVYDVTETRYSLSEDPVQVSYQLRAEVVDSFPTINNLYTYVIRREKRATASDPWQPVDTWSAREENGQIIVSEGNTPYVKFSSPLAAENVWDGNAYNTLGEDQYRYTGIAIPMDLNGMTFDNTITVEQEDNEDAIVFRDERKEVYALHLGLVYKELIQLNYCTDDVCLGQQRIDQGIEIRMVIKDYGKQ